MSLLTNEMIDFFLQGIHEVSRGESVVKEADSQTVLSVKKDVFKKVVVEADAKKVIDTQLKFRMQRIKSRIHNCTDQPIRPPGFLHLFFVSIELYLKFLKPRICISSFTS